MSEAATVGRPADPVVFDELVDAWTSLEGTHAVPVQIDVLKWNHAASGPKVCRLAGCASRGSDVVAKCSDNAAVEAILYEHVLGRVPGTPRCYGIASGRDGDQCWIFLEYVEGERCEAKTPAHRALTARWLAALHSITSRMQLDQLLPRYDSAFYRGQLRTARHAMSTALANPIIGGDDRSRLAAAVDRCDFLESQWDVLEILIEDVPPGLVHGDLQSKNVRISDRAGEVELIAFDWEFSGHGVPLADLAQFAVKERWRDLAGILDQMGFTDVSDHERLRQLATAGKVLRLTTCLEWVSRGCFHTTPRALDKIAAYNQRLHECLRSLNAEA